MADWNLNMVRGDTLSFGMEIEGLDTDLSSAYLTCKKSYSDNSTVFQKSIGDGITKAGTGVYRIRVAPEDTASVEPGSYFYDFQIGVNSDIFTIMRGVLEIKPDVTV